MVDYRKEMDNLKSPEKNKKQVSKVKKCSYYNCPMNAAVFINGRYSCCFHTSPDYHDDVTVAIKNNKNFLKNYNAMVKWRVKDWQERKSHLMNHEFVPMLETDTPSGYLVRFFRFISTKISDEASATVKRRLDNFPGDFDEV